MLNLRTTTVLTGALLAATVAPAAPAAPTAPCQVHVILFVPSDFQPPANYQPRVDEVVNCTEAFFARELRRWGHAQVVMPFCRGDDGRVPVMVLRGTKKAAEYKPVAVRAEVMDELRRQNRITDARQVWWIMVYAGDPPQRFSAFLGGYGEQIGGWAVCNFDTRPGRIDPQAPLGSEFLAEMALKGMIHELGHGFQLPHIGPLRRDNAGNTLMGPTHANFRRVAPGREERVYLSEAEAAMLATHPAFRGLPDVRGPLPKPDVQNLKCVVDRQENAIVVSGRVRAAVRPVYAVVGDESDARPGEYWTKTYVDKVGEDGAFRVTVSEPATSNGTLKVWFVFENGVQTGDGRERGRSSGIAQAYTWRGSRWIFN